MRIWLPFAGVGILAALAGASLWLAGRAPEPPKAAESDASPAAILGARFVGPAGEPRNLGELRGTVLIVNFWATWCAPCREEMPGFVRLQSRWQDKGVRFVGLAQDDPAKVRAFGQQLGVNYPLWTSDTAATDLSRRLGNRLGVLPHTVLLDPDGRVLESRIGVFREEELESRLRIIAGSSAK